MLHGNNETGVKSLHFGTVPVLQAALQKIVNPVIIDIGVRNSLNGRDAKFQKLKNSRSFPPHVYPHNNFDTSADVEEGCMYNVVHTRDHQLLSVLISVPIPPIPNSYLYQQLNVLVSKVIAWLFIMPISEHFYKL